MLHYIAFKIVEVNGLLIILGVHITCITTAHKKGGTESDSKSRTMNESSALAASPSKNISPL